MARSPQAGACGMHACVPPLLAFRCCSSFRYPILCSLITCRFEAVFTRHTGRTFSLAMEGLWKSRAFGGKDVCIPPFKMPSMQLGSLHHEEVMCDGYRPKMLLFTLDELFYIFDQIKRQWNADEKIVVACEILCLSTQQCTERWHGVEKTSVLNALSLLNVNNVCHLKRLAWAVYNGGLLVGG